ncbi:hypothetical protein [Fictibacillus macauensis]|nr:hypothetical protein [Fictibacillus macauensis]
MNGFAGLYELLAIIWKIAGAVGTTVLFVAGGMRHRCWRKSYFGRP